MKTSMCIGEVYQLDTLKQPGTTEQGQKWSFFTDRVMGGLSEGNATVSTINNIKCYQMIGKVTTENNGGFIQIRTETNPVIDAKKFTGIYLKVYGNNKSYNIHVRTSLTLAPWQYYAYSFLLKEEWTLIKAPFAKFKKSNIYQPSKLTNQKIKSIGFVAGFDDFDADACLAEIGFY